MKTSITRTNPVLRRVFKAAAVLVFWISVWGILAYAVDKEVLLPSPLSVLKVFSVLLFQSEFWSSIFASLLRILIGYIAGCGIALILAVLSFRFSVVDALFSPVLSVIRAVPVASFIILALIWIGNDRVPSFTAFLMVLPIVTANTITGLKSADNDLLEVCRLYRAGTLKTTRLLYIPAVRPYFLTAARTSLGLAWKAGIAAEVLCTTLSSSIGGKIYESKLYVETPSLFAWTITVIIISMLIEKLLFRIPILKIKSSVPNEVTT